MLHSSSGRAALRGAVMPARLRCAGGSAGSAASSRAISVWRFTMANQGDWIGSAVCGGLTKRPSARTFLSVLGAQLNPSRG
jgi:hypothetical protein